MYFSAQRCRDEACRRCYTRRRQPRALSMIFNSRSRSGRVLTCTVHEAPSHASDRVDRAEALTFVPDGFSLQAFVFGPLWLLAHRLWLGFAVYAAVAVAILASNQWLSLPTLAAQIAFLGLHAVIGFEADTIERLHLEQRGWSSLGSVTGTTVLDCERRFFETWLHRQPVLSTDERVHRTVAAVDTAASQRTTAPTATARGAVAGRLAALWGRR